MANLFRCWVNQSMAIAGGIFLCSCLGGGGEIQAQETAITPDFLLNEEGTLSETDEKLDNGRYLDVLEIETEADQDLVILLGSDEFDTYLFVFDGEWNKVAENDDYRGTHSGLVINNPDGGLLYLVPTSTQPEQLGTYYLTVREASPLEKNNLEGNRLSTEAWTLYEENTLSSLRQAQKKWEQALVIYQEVGNEMAVANTFDQLGFVADRLGEKETALHYFNQALAIYESQNSAANQALTINNLGHVYSSTGNKQTALEYYQRALDILEKTGDRRGMGSALNNIGAVYGALGEPEKALEYYERSMPILREVGNRLGEGRTLLNFGSIYDTFGEKQAALDYYEQALKIFREIGDLGGEASALNNIGVVYDDLGEKDRALTYYETAIPLSQEVGDRLGEARTLSNIGIIYSGRGQSTAALDYYQQALPILQDIGDRLGETTTLSNMGLLYDDLGDYDSAITLYEQALTLAEETGNRLGKATVLNNLGTTYENLQNDDGAIAAFEESLALSKIVGDRAAQALTFYNLARLYRNQAQVSTALTNIEQAIAIVEDLRVTVASPELRQSYFSTVQFYYDLYIDLLMELEAANPGGIYARRAFLASEQSRARTLLDLLTEAQADIRTGISADLLAQEQELSENLDKIEQARITIYGDRFSTAQDKLDIDHALTLATAAYQEFQDEIRRASPQYANLKYPEPLSISTLQQELLDKDTALVQYSFTEKSSYLWVVTQDSFQSYILPDKTTINTAITAVRSAITSVRSDVPAPLQRRLDQERLQAIQTLSDLILLPAATEIAGKRLAIVADEDLHFLPFSVLSLAGQEYQPLGDRQEIINLPSASTLKTLRENQIETIPPSASLAVIADPVFRDTDCRLTSDDPDCTASSTSNTLVGAENLNMLALQRSAREFNDVNWDRLLGTRQEARGILDLLSQQRETLTAFDFDANRELIIGDRLQNYDLIHIATHGFLNTVEPELSGIVLSLLDKNEQPQNGFLRLNDIFNLKLNADLLVLSACQTGLGDQVQGEGLVGLSRGFMYAGVPRIIVSLWQVDDAATAEFMTRFYRLLLREGLTPAAALQQTQLEMRTQTQWTHPYYWAAFVLQGDWR